MRLLGDEAGTIAETGRRSSGLWRHLSVRGNDHLGSGSVQDLPSSLFLELAGRAVFLATSPPRSMAISHHAKPHALRVSVIRSGDTAGGLRTAIAFILRNSPRKSKWERRASLPDVKPCASDHMEAHRQVLQSQLSSPPGEFSRWSRTQPVKRSRKRRDVCSVPITSTTAPVLLLVQAGNVVARRVRLRRRETGPRHVRGATQAWMPGLATRSPS